MNFASERSYAQTILSLLTAVSLVGLGLIFYIALDVGQRQKDPYFYRADGAHTFFCYVEQDPRRRKLYIEFRDQGRVASVRFNDIGALLQFERGGLAGDIYRSGQVKLMLDPEAHVTGLAGSSVGPCQEG